MMKTYLLSRRLFNVAVRPLFNLDTLFYWVPVYVYALLLASKYFQWKKFGPDTAIYIMLPFLLGALIQLRKGQLDLLQKKFLSVGDVLRADYPEDYHHRLASADTLWVFGTNLRRIFQHDDDREQYLRKALEGSGKIRALLVSPKPPDKEPAASTFTAMQDARLEIKSQAIESEIGQIHSNLVRLCQLRHQFPSQVVIKTINYPLSYGIDGVDIDTWRGVLYIRYYPFHNKDRPILRLTPGDAFYDFYKEQIEVLWSRGSEWQCL
jgi:hypothetical protein